MKKPSESKIGILFLKEIWQHFSELRSAKKDGANVEWRYINSVFNALGIGTEPTIQYLMTSDISFSDFEDWILENGTVSREMITYFNSSVLKVPSEHFVPEEKVFDESDMAKWEKDGYVVLKGAVSKEDCLKSVKYICDEIGADLKNNASWYSPHPLKNGIMIQLFRSEILDKNRLSRKVRLAFEQLWQKDNLMVSMDRVSFNPPETESYHFPGPNLHWDVSLKQPIPYGIQGLLYLADTAEDQGAFTVIPGFHNKIATWLDGQKEGGNPREVNLLEHFEERPIAGEAGDLVIWNHCLPHGSRPNHSDLPRIVQYITYQPLDLQYQSEWI